jgi:hypothetical protein
VLLDESEMVMVDSLSGYGEAERLSEVDPGVGARFLSAEEEA